VATLDKDFKVKKGLQVNEGGSFGGTVSVATPTLGNHAATKEYVDEKPGGYTVSETPPENPTEGAGWYKSSTAQTFLYYDGFWVESGSSMAGPTGPIGPGLQLVQSPLFYNEEYESLSIDLSAYATELYVDNAISTVDLSDYATESYVDNAVSSVDVTEQLQEVQVATIMGAY
jgi:hypothetical protein